MLSEINQSRKEKTFIPFFEVSSIVKIIETASKVIDCQGLTWREVVYNEYRISIRENGKVLEIDSANDCIRMWIYLMP
jgi:hypothetical protein